MHEPDALFRQELMRREQNGLLRRSLCIDSAQGPWIRSGGRRLLLCCSNNYLGLAEHPSLVRAARTAMKRYGFGTGASRLVSGTLDIHEALERAIAAFKGTDAAILFNSGYSANTGVVPALAGEGDAIFSDALNHASIVDGCRLSRARTFIYRHRDMEHLEGLLRGHAARHKVIVTDGVFSMEGDIAPLPDLVHLAEKHSALLMVDDAHATGVLGPDGRGTAWHFGLQGRVPVQMGTFGKALGSFGAFVAGSHDLVRYLLNASRSFMFSTSLPPTVCAATLAAIEVAQHEPWRRESLWRNRTHLVDGLTNLGISSGPSESPIVPIIIGDAGAAVRSAERLAEGGILALAIRPPAVPDGSSRIRITVMATHSERDISLLLDAIADLRSEGVLPHGTSL